MIKNFSKITIIVVMFLLVSACQTTRETSTNNIGGRASNIANDGFDKKKAAINRVNSGLTYLNHNNFERAKFHLDKALSYDPKSSKVHYALGIYYQRVSALEKAQQHFDLALDSEPNNPEYLNAYGAYLCEKADYKKADKVFQKAIAIPTYTEVSYTYYNVGFCLLKQNKIDDAEEYFRKALNRNKNMVNALIEMAKIEFNKERYERAVSYINRYESNGKTTAESAWLALRAAHYLRDKDSIARYSSILEENFPDSNETVLFLDNKKQWM